MEITFTLKKYSLKLCLLLIPSILLSIHSFGRVSKESSFVKTSNFFIDKESVSSELFEEVLQKKDSRNTFQLITHGRPGELFIDGKWKNSKEIARWLTLLGVGNSEMGIRNSLAVQHLNIYGCEFAKGEKGLAAVKYLEKALGISVSASTNVTGKNGDWILEVGNSNEVIALNEYNGDLQCTNAVSASTNTPNTSCLTDNGALTLAIATVTLPNANYQFSIDGGVTWQASNVFTGLAPGVYNLRYKDITNNCYSATVQVTVANSATAPTAPTATITTALSNCTTPNAVITATAPTPLTNYQFSDDGGVTWQSSNAFSNLSAGTYAIKSKLISSGCVSTTSTSLTVASPTVTAPTATVTTALTNCTTPNAVITATAPTPLTNYQFSDDGGVTWQSSNIFTNLSAGTYQIKSKLISSGCVSATSTSVTVTSPTITTPTGTATAPSSCTSPNGSITPTAPTPVTSYQFSIDGGTTWVSSTGLTGLAAGTYTIMAKSTTSGCLSPSSASIVVPASSTAPITPVPTIVNNTNCTATPNGSITFPSASYSPLSNFKFSIDGGNTWQSSNVFSNLGEGNYNLVVKNISSGCLSATKISALTNAAVLPTAPTATLTASNCTPSSGKITVNTPLGANYVYSIDNGATWQSSTTFSGLEASATAGSYIVSAKNTTTGCTNDPAAPAIYDVTSVANPAVPTAAVTNPTSCSSPNGTIKVTPASGQTASLFSIDGGITWQASNTFSGLAAGTYKVVYTSATTGCVSTALTETLTVTTPAAPTATTLNPTSCSSPNGSITVTASNASQYSIDGGVTWQTSNIFPGLSDSTYSVVYKSATTGCVSTSLAKTLTITSPVAPTATTVNPTNCTSPNGSITVTATNASQYSIDGGLTWQTSNAFTGLKSGTYSVVYKSSTTGCISTALAKTLTAPVVPTTPTTVAASNTDCANPNGTITVTAPTPLSNYTFSIDGGITFQTSPYFVGLSDSTYNVVIKSISTGCLSLVKATTVAAPAVVATPVITTTNLTNCSPNNGIITFTAPLDGNNYKYSIDGGTTWQTSNTFNSLATGTYSCMIQNINTGCVSVSTLKTLTNGSPTVAGTVVNATSCIPNGTITITTPALGTGYTYSIDGGTTWQTSNFFSGLDYGTYSLTVKNTTTGCISNSTQKALTNVAAVSVPTFTTTVQHCSLIDGTITLTAPTPLASYQFSKDGGLTWQSGSSFTNLTSGTYALMAKNTSSGCVSKIDSAVISHNTTGCSDSDGDGIIDSLDLDDDNDGILDTSEMVCPAQLFTGTATFTATSASTATLTTPTGTADVTISSSQGGVSVTSSNTGSTYFTHNEANTYSNSITIQNTSGVIDVVRWGIGAGELTTNGGIATEPQVTTLNWTGGGTAYINNPNYQITDLNGVPIPTGTIVSSGFQFMFTDREVPSASNWYFDINTGTDATGTFAITTADSIIRARQTPTEIWSIGVPGYSLGTCADKDTDGDGIPDRLDLDSDGDGCTDAIEGGAAFTTTNLASSTMPGGNSGTSYNGTVSYPVTQNLGNTVGTTSTTSGIPTIAGTGQSVGTSEDKTQKDANCVACSAGTTAMTLSATSKSNVCPATTADISTLVSSSCPSGSSLEWHTSSTPTTANIYLTPTTANAGIYYPFCYDSVIQCYNPAPTTGVTVSIVACCTVTTPSGVTANPTAVCPGSSSILNGTCATGTLTWYSDAALTTTVTSPVSPTSTATYYGQCVISSSCKSSAVSTTVSVNPLPAAPTITPSSQNVCIGASATLTASGCAGTVVWSPTNATTTSIVVSPTVAGGTNYSVTCTVNGCTSLASAITTITGVTPPTNPSISVDKNSVCLGTGLTLTGLNCASPNILTWYEDGVSIGTGLSLSYTPTTSGTHNYTASCSGTGAVVCSTPSSSSLAVVINTASAGPGLSASATTICTGASTVLTASGCTGTYVWSTGQNGTSITVNPTSTSTYNVSCLVSGCLSNASSISITVNPIPTTPSISGTSVICSGSSTTLTANGCTGTVVWNTSATGSTLSVSTPGTYSATCSITTNGVSCTSLSSAVTTVSYSVASTAAAPTLSATTVSNICPVLTTDISTLVTSTCPTGTTLEWHTVASGFTTSNLVVDPTMVSAGTYYPVCRDTTNDCYGSAPTTGVTVVATICCKSGNVAPLMIPTN